MLVKKNCLILRKSSLKCSVASIILGRTRQEIKVKQINPVIHSFFSALPVSSILFCSNFHDYHDF